MFIYGENRHRRGFCFEWNGQFCFVECLPMECSSLCKIFERFSTAVQWMAQHKQGGQHMTHMNKKTHVYIYSAQQSASVKTKIPGYVPRYKCTNCTRKTKQKQTNNNNNNKNYWPLFNFKGYEIDPVLSEILLSQDKVDTCTEVISSLLEGSKSTFLKLQSVNGLFNFACVFVVPVRAFLRRLIDLMV